MVAWPTSSISAFLAGFLSILAHVLLALHLLLGRIIRMKQSSSHDLETDVRIPISEYMSWKNKKLPDDWKPKATERRSDYPLAIRYLSTTDVWINFKLYSLRSPHGNHITLNLTLLLYYIAPSGRTEVFPTINGSTIKGSTPTIKYRVAH